MDGLLKKQPSLSIAPSLENVVGETGSAGTKNAIIAHSLRIVATETGEGGERRANKEREGVVFTIDQNSGGRLKRRIRPQQTYLVQPPTELREMIE